MKITASEFESLMSNVTPPLAVATSGGSDSLALLFLTHRWAQNKGVPVQAVTVDHGLRPESRQEALSLAKWCEERQIPHTILTWEGDKPTTGLQSSAREARYQLLLSWCKAQGISSLLLAHHLEDQEETFWLRLSSGSGLEGLTGMKNKSVREEISLHRPLLKFSKERLRATLKAKNISWSEDPSNESSKYFRGRLRKTLEEEGLTAMRLGNVMHKLEEDADFIQSMLQKTLKHEVTVHPEGYLSFKAALLTTLHPALLKRLLAYLMKWFSGNPHAPRSETVLGVLDKLEKKSPFTAGGIYWSQNKNHVLLFREASKTQESIPLHSLTKPFLWDHRFWIDPLLKEVVSRETILAPLGPLSKVDIEINFSTPKRSLQALPSLWEQGKLVAVPQLGYTTQLRETDLSKYIFLKEIF